MAHEPAGSHGTSTEYPRASRVEIPNIPWDKLPLDMLHVALLGGWNDDVGVDCTGKEQFAGELQALQPAKKRTRTEEEERDGEVSEDCTDKEQFAGELQALQPAKKRTRKEEEGREKSEKRGEKKKRGPRGPAIWQLKLAAAAAAAADEARRRHGLQDYADKLQALQPATGN